MTFWLFLYKYLVLLVIVDAQSKISDVMYVSEIIPDLLSHVPQSLVFVKFPNGDKVKLGNKLSLSHGRHCPRVIWKSPEGKLHTLIMLDVDAPSFPEKEPFVHWLVANIPEAKIKKGLELASYTSPFVKQKSWDRRIVFLVYQQKRVEEFYHFWKKNDSRQNFGLDEFTAMYNLGEPMAINFFIGTSSKPAKQSSE